MTSGAGNPSAAAADLVAAARTVASTLADHGDEGERLRRLPAPSVEALRDAGLLRMCVPAAYGGPEADPMTLVTAIEEVARADGAAGWCTMIASTTSSLAAFLPTETAKEIYGDPDVVTGGVFAPNGVGAATELDGVPGYRVTGRWAWGSGTQHCQWILGGARCDDETFRLCWFEARDVTFHDTWFTSGMRGSGSLDFSVEDAFAPDRRTIQPGLTRPTVDSPLAHFPNFTLLATGVAAVGLGVARHALDEVVDVAQGKRPQFSSRTLADSAYTQIEIARAEARLRAARAFLHEALAAAWGAASAGDQVSLEARTAIRLAAVHVAETGAAVVDIAYTLAGGTSVYDTSPLGRCLRDAHVVTQHIQTAPKLYETIGKLLLGRDVDTSML